MTRDEFFAQKAKGALWDVGVSIQRGNPLPLDSNSVFESKAKADKYVAGVLAYPGQIIAVVEASATTIYYIDQAMALQEVGKIPLGDGKSIKVAEDGTISIYDVENAVTGSWPVMQADGKVKWQILESSKTTYGIAKLGTATAGSAATYQLYSTTDSGVTKNYIDEKIEIPKDLVVKSGVVKTYADKAAATADGMSAEQADTETFPGTFIKLTIANKAGDTLFINVSGLIEYVSSGSKTGDDIELVVDDDHKITATLSEGVKASLGKANTALQRANIDTGETAGTIKVGNDEVPVAGLKDAAYKTVAEIETKITDDKIGTLGTTSTGSNHTVKSYVDAKEAELTNAINGVKGSVDGLGALAKKDKVAKTDLVKDLSDEIDGKATKATTLAGYKIGDAYTKTEVDTEIGNAKTAAATDAKNKADAVSNALTPKITKLEETHAKNADDSFKTVAEEVTAGIGALKLPNTYAAKSLEKTVTDHTANTDVHIEAAERTKWDTASTQADNNKKAIDVINGDEKVDGSIAKAVATAKSGLEESIKAVKVTADSAKETADANTKAIGADAIAGTIKGRIKAAETAIDTLNGTSATVGSVAKAVADAQTALLDSASADYNTLGKLETKVKAAQSTADGAVSAIGSDTTAGTVKARIKALETDVTAASTGLKARMTAAENDIDTLQGQISGVFHFKGSATKNGSNLYVTTPDGAAQVVNQIVGDVYTVGDEEWAWDGTSWIMLGITTDLSNYYNKSQIDGKIGGITGAFHFRGVATSFEADGTPAYVVQGDKKYVSGIELKEGDVWLDSEGQQFAWNGTEWIKLGYMTDLSAYSTTSQVESMIEGALTGLYTFKGEAGSLDNIVNPSRGDVYIVGGKQFAWSGNDWVEITTNVDLSSYSTTEQVNELINTAKSATLGVAASDATTKSNAAYANALAKVNELKGDATKTVGAIEDEVDNLKALVSDTETGLDKRVTDNATAIAAINNSETGILAKANKHADDADDALSARITPLENLKPAEGGAQANKIETIATGDGDLKIESKKVTIPKATATKLGLVKGSAADAENKVFVESNGEMTVNNINVNKLVQTAGDTLILNCGTSQV